MSFITNKNMSFINMLFISNENDDDEIKKYAHCGYKHDINIDNNIELNGFSAILFMTNTKFKNEIINLKIVLKKKLSICLQNINKKFIFCENIFKNIDKLVLSCKHIKCINNLFSIKSLIIIGDNTIDVGNLRDLEELTIGEDCYYSFITNIHLLNKLKKLNMPLSIINNYNKNIRKLCKINKNIIIHVNDC